MTLYCLIYCGVPLKPQTSILGTSKNVQDTCTEGSGEKMRLVSSNIPFVLLEEILFCAL